MESIKFQNTVPDEFWKIIQEAEQDPAKFRKLFDEMDRDKIIRFYWTYEEVSNHLRTEKFLPYVHPDLSEDGLAELANWVVAQGKDYFENILENPQLIPPKKDDPGLQSALLELVWD